MALTRHFCLNDGIKFSVLGSAWHMRNQPCSDDTGSGVARNQGHWGLENVEINAPNADLERHIFDEKYRFIQ